MSHEYLSPSCDGHIPSGRSFENQEEIIGWCNGVDFVKGMRKVPASDRVAIICYIADIFCLHCGVERDLLPGRICHCENDE
jgi:hypothetical protein